MTTERLLVVFTRSHATHGDDVTETPDEFVTLWKQPKERAHWISGPLDGRRLLVVHAAEYGPGAAAIARQALADLENALRAYDNVVPKRGDIGIAFHGDKSKLPPASFAPCLGRQPLFVCRYTGRHPLWISLAEAVTTGADVHTTFDAVWTALKASIALSYYTAAGVLCHRVRRLAGLFNDVSYWLETDFGSVLAEEIAASHQAQPLNLDEFRGLFAGPGSFEELFNEAAVKLPKQYRKPVDDASLKMFEQIRKDVKGRIVLPEELPTLVAAASSAEGIRQWVADRDQARRRSRLLLAWWQQLNAALDELLLALSASEREPSDMPADASTR